MYMGKYIIIIIIIIVCIEACLRPQISCHPLTTIIRQRKKDIGEIEKYSQKNVRIVYNSLCVCVPMCVFMCIYTCVCVCVFVCV